jgi:hypothetical protein
MIPLEIQEYIFEFIQPYLTREDWRTCRLQESNSIQQLVQLFQKGKPRNHFWGVRYKDWTFYEKLRFSTIESGWEEVFPCKSLSSWYFRKSIGYTRHNR